MIVAYLRVSTERQTLENQRNEIEKFAESKGLVIDRWIMETVSGKTNCNNRKLGRLLKQLKKGDTLIVTEVSRLSRTLLEIMSMMSGLIKKGVSLYSTKDNFSFDDSINSKVLLFAFGLVAELERNLISMRTREALALRKRQGVKLGRPKGSCNKMTNLKRHKTEISRSLTSGESVASICRRYKVSRSTFYRYLNVIGGRFL